MYRDSGNIDLCTADLVLCTGTVVILIYVRSGRQSPKISLNEADTKATITTEWEAELTFPTGLHGFLFYSILFYSILFYSVLS